MNPNPHKFPILNGKYHEKYCSSALKQNYLIEILNNIAPGVKFNLLQKNNILDSFTQELSHLNYVKSHFNHVLITF